MNHKVYFIVGATATGKSEAAVSLAKEIGAEIISCDSMLMYKEPKIITAAPDEKMLNSVPHHFVGNISVRDEYSVFEYYSQASELIKNLINYIFHH